MATNNRAPICPNCNGSRVGTVENLTAVAIVESIAPDGSIVEYGLTEVDWESSQTRVTKSGHPHMACLSCAHEWVSRSIHLGA